ncbi:MAG: hypothetical protein DMG45_09840 [Acidobacteria bacterium]|nr:MAG: hypothetical protein DMG45_09840 [Acidobacteriota bacterium]
MSGERHLGCASPKSTSFPLDGLQAVQAGPARVQVAPTLAGQAAQRARLVRVRSMLAQVVPPQPWRIRAKSVRMAALEPVELLQAAAVRAQGEQVVQEARLFPRYLLKVRETQAPVVWMPKSELRTPPLGRAALALLVLARTEPPAQLAQS